MDGGGAAGPPLRASLQPRAGPCPVISFRSITVTGFWADSMESVEKGPVDLCATGSWIGKQLHYWG